MYDWFSDEVVENYEYDSPDDGANPAPVATIQILAYGVESTHVPEQFYSLLSEEGAPPYSFDGLWTGRYTATAESESDGWLTVRLQLDSEGNTVFGDGKDTVGPFTASGSFFRTKDDPSAQGRLVLHVTYRFLARRPILRFDGLVDYDVQGAIRSIAGSWGHWADADARGTSLGTFYMHRTSSVVARHLPLAHASDHECSSARARWNLILSVVRDQVQRKTTESRLYFRQHLTARRSKPLLQWYACVEALNTAQTSRLRWNRVLHLVEEQVRRRMWSKSYFAKRREDKRAAVEAYMRVLAAKEPDRYLRVWPGDDTDYWGILKVLEERIFPEDAAFYRWIAERRLQTERVHM